MTRSQRKGSTRHAHAHKYFRFLSVNMGHQQQMAENQMEAFQLHAKYITAFLYETLYRL